MKVVEYNYYNTSSPNFDVVNTGMPVLKVDSIRTVTQLSNNSVVNTTNHINLMVLFLILLKTYSDGEDMNRVTIHESIVNNKIFEEFQTRNGISLFNHSANSCSLEDFLAVSYVLCPDLIEIDGYIFIADFFIEEGDAAIEKVKRLEMQFNNNKRDIQQWVNSWSFADFFIGNVTEGLDNSKILEQFGEIIVYYWSRRAKEIFPEKNIIVEVGNEIMGELGLSVTLYEE
ncbi:hypothetical protein [Paenibacillus sp. FSL H7-0357]|uniref:hypothetical protein n=2 Tax=Paenibacillus sp. FSL H7-0357 TaxID=1536774 RepID=UPI0018CD9F70|nr:hypothetical protein [Paenibacillus sp. FSL H7-0357]